MHEVPDSISGFSTSHFFLNFLFRGLFVTVVDSKIDVEDVHLQVFLMSFWDPTQLCGKTAINNLDLCMNYEQEEDSCKFFCRRKPQRGYKYSSPPNEDFSVLMMLVRFGFSCFILRSI